MLSRRRLPSRSGKRSLTFRNSSHSRTRCSYPRTIFPSSDHPRRDFNDIFMMDLTRSKSLLFRGISARHTAARLRAHRDSEMDVAVIVPDLRVPESLSNRIDYIRKFELPATGVDALRARVKHQVAVGLVGLYQARFDCSGISITLSPSPPLDRYEILQNGLWVTLFSEVNALASQYPRALRFDNDSLMFQMQRSEFVRLRDSSPSSDFASTVRHLNVIFGPCGRTWLAKSSTPELSRLCNEFDEFGRTYAREIETGEGR